MIFSCLRPACQDFYIEPEISHSPLTPFTKQDVLELQQKNIRNTHRLPGHDDYRSQMMRAVIQNLIEESIPYRDGHYAQAYHKLMAMKRGQREFSVKEAVFAVENAYLSNRLSYENFERRIKGFVNFIHEAIDQSGLDPAKESTKHYVLFQFMSDTLTIDHPQLEKTLTHYPMTYDFEDFRGGDDYANVFVSKLMYEGSGQCRSMPLLYLILAEELGIDAHLALAPEHSYIKIQDQSGEFYNLELTQGTYVSDGFIMGSGYINSNALKNKLYMDTLSQNQLVTQLLNDLNTGYVRKYGWDDYAIARTDEVLNEAPDNLVARMHKSNSILDEMQREANKNRYVSVEHFARKNNYGRYLNHLWGQQYQKLMELGYQAMPEDAYKAWLASLNEQKRKQKRTVKMDDNLQKF
ncbi:MAG: hypothetical protein AAF693_12930 [Bacteroidota bacterium]